MICHSLQDIGIEEKQIVPTIIHIQQSSRIINEFLSVQESFSTWVQWLTSSIQLKDMASPISMEIQCNHLEDITINWHLSEEMQEGGEIQICSELVTQHL